MLVLFFVLIVFLIFAIPFAVLSWQVLLAFIRSLEQAHGRLFWVFVASYGVGLYQFLSCFGALNTFMLFYPVILICFVLPPLLIVLYWLRYPFKHFTFFTLFSIYIVLMSVLQYQTRNQLSTHLFFSEHLYKNQSSHSFHQAVGWQQMKQWLKLKEDNPEHFEAQLEQAYQILFQNGQEQTIKELVTDILTHPDFYEEIKEEELLCCFGCGEVKPDFSTLKKIYVRETFKLWAKQYAYSQDLLIHNSLMHLNIAERIAFYNCWFELAKEDTWQIPLMSHFFRKMQIQDYDKKYLYKKADWRYIANDLIILQQKMQIQYGHFAEVLLALNEYLIMVNSLEAEALEGTMHGSL